MGDVLRGRGLFLLRELLHGSRGFAFFLFDGLKG